jgi:hypothetical protein
MDQPGSDSMTAWQWRVMLIWPDEAVDDPENIKNFFRAKRIGPRPKIQHWPIEVEFGTATTVLGKMLMEFTRMGGRRRTIPFYVSLDRYMTDLRPLLADGLFLRVCDDAERSFPYPYKAGGVGTLIGRRFDYLHFQCGDKLGLT